MDETMIIEKMVVHLFLKKLLITKRTTSTIQSAISLFFSSHFILNSCT